MSFPSGAGASGSRNLPWAFPRILQVNPEIKWPSGGNGCRGGHEYGAVCSKGASSSIIPSGRSSAIAARAAARRRTNGRVTRRSNDTGRRRRASRSATAKAGSTGNGRAAGNTPRKRQLARPRGSSLKIFFRGLLRPARLLRSNPAPAAKSLATFLLPRLPALPGARPAARAALERGLS